VLAPLLAPALDPELRHRLVQAAIAAAAGLAVALLARRRGIRVGGDVAIAMARGIVQIVAVGAVLAFVLRGPAWGAALVLAGMVLAAAATSARRARGVPGALATSALALAAGPGVMIIVMTWLGVIDPALATLIPVGSMLIANAMNTNGLALNRFRADVLAHVPEIETALALGAETGTSVVPYVRGAVEASLIPAIDSLRSLGIVWIPGLMAGMVLTGASPVTAALYQFVVLAMMFASSALTALVSTTLIKSRVFSPADQLTLKV
jgi:putative ABC transport system permease protein